MSLHRLLNRHDRNVQAGANGRVQKLNESPDFAAIIDDAHIDDAFFNQLHVSVEQVFVGFLGSRREDAEHQEEEFPAGSVTGFCVAFRHDARAPFHADALRIGAAFLIGRVRDNPRFSLEGTGTDF